MNTSNITNYKPKDFAELLGVSVKTLQRWDREGILKANRTPTDRRYYTYDQYLQFKGINTENDNRINIVRERQRKPRRFPTVTGSYSGNSTVSHSHSCPMFLQVLVRSLFFIFGSRVEKVFQAAFPSR